MNSTPLSAITIRNDLRPGDLGALIRLHGDLYFKEYDYGIVFECYVAEGLIEFYRQYDPSNHRVWICEHHNKMVGFMLLMKRGEAAQLRYFIIRPEYRGIGLGSKLMKLFLEFLQQCGYPSVYLWTTHEQILANEMYRKHGFVLTEERDSVGFGKPVRERKYELTI